MWYLRKKKLLKKVTLATILFLTQMLLNFHMQSHYIYNHILKKLDIFTLSWMARRLEGCIKTLYPRLVIPLTCRGASGALLSQAFTSSRLTAITGLWWSPLKRLSPSPPSLVLCNRSILKPGDCKDIVRAPNNQRQEGSRITSGLLRNLL